LTIVAARPLKDTRITQRLGEDVGLQTSSVGLLAGDLSNGRNPQLSAYNTVAATKPGGGGLLCRNEGGSIRIKAAIKDRQSEGREGCRGMFVGGRKVEWRRLEVENSSN
jgi:hypothetical protein